MLTGTDLEVKAAAHADLAGAFDDFMRAFEAFKETNDRRLGEVERRMSADPLTADKLDRIDRALDEHKRIVDALAHRATRPPVGGGTVLPAAAGRGHEHKAAFEAYVRRGDTHPMRSLEGKALSVGTGADGGYVVPDETERSINRAVRDISPIRAIAGIRQVSGSVYRKPFAVTGWAYS